tara:strand:- start:5971 stop:9339 length:3369 start_codon:yes stop_codon:yes gene_type:complete
MTRKPQFWTVFILLFIGSIYFFIRNYDKAFPVLSLDIRMNREMALDAADDLSKKFNWKPEKYRSAVTFYSQRDVQTFVEREGGGLETFKSLSIDSVYFPYGWQVRLFQEDNPNETSVWFTPSGDPYCFRQKLGENEPGVALSRDSAFSVAMVGIHEPWGVNLDDYQLVEEAEEVQPSGRVDYTFTYQRSGFEIGNNGFARLRLVVSGDVLTELVHYIKIPEAFQRRFDEMRSANDTIAFSASMGMALLYGLGGIVLGIFFLLRQRWILWKSALIWGVFIALVQTLSEINFLPLMWMEYDTSITERSFILQVIIGSLANFFLMSSIYTLSFIAAESLTRKAFPERIQFWKLWSPEAASSLPILGRTISGYLTAGLFLFYSLVFYMYTHNSLGWWSPADTDYDPNILAAYFPWLTSIAISLGAGFWEECLFRAVPLAGAALLGDRFGKRNLFIGIAMGVQALIFGAGHANYPVQPAYARVVELIIPSLVFGFIYLRFGLLTGIVMHYAIDVVFISLPLFIAQAPGIWLHRIMVILLLMVPIWVIIYHRYRIGNWKVDLGQIYNRDWKPPASQLDYKEPSLLIDESLADEPRYISNKILGFLAGLGLFMWISQITFQGDLPNMEILRKDAEKIGTDALVDWGFLPDSSWNIESISMAGSRQDYRFIWQTSGRDLFTGMIGTYLVEPSWLVRFRLLDDDVARRAEEYICWIDPRGSKTRIIHKLPEDTPGASLSEEEARAISIDFLKKTYSFKVGDLVELEARSMKKPNRLDWEFQYQDTTAIDLKEGELRLMVKLAGKDIVDHQRMVHVPEDWSRDENQKNAKQAPFNFIMILVVILSLMAAIVWGLIRWSRKQFQLDLFLKTLVILIIVGLLSSWNNWPEILWSFSTSEPYNDQLFQAVFSSGLGIIFISLFQALLAGSTHSLVHHNQNYVRTGTRIEKGIYIGLFLSGLLAIIGSFFPSLGPNAGLWGALSTRVPFLGVVLQDFSGFIMLTIIGLVIVNGLNTITKNWNIRKPIAVIYIYLIGFAMCQTLESALESIPLWIFSSLIIGTVLLIIYKEFLRFHPALIPIITATLSVLGSYENGLLNLYSGSFMGAVFASIIIYIIAYIWYHELLKKPNQKAVVS